MQDALVLEPGDHYGEYEVVSLLGRGAFAVVYRVRSESLPNDGALKLSREPVGHGPQAKRALREVEVLRALTNPHVVHIHGSGIGEDGRAYIVMDYLEGVQLDRFHAFDRPMPPGQAAWLIHQACLGLAEAHVFGIVHRDVKPENLWVEPDHKLKVIDFGLARSWNAASGAGANVTMGHFLIGTPHYTQPEQLHTDQLTPASDVYSLGTILYELLSGHSVFFEGVTWSQIREQLRDNPVPWIEAHARRPVVPLHRYPHCRDVPRALIELVYRCLEKNPIARPQNAGELSTALGEILHYDFGAAMGATIRITHPYGGYEERLLLPGSHRIGSSDLCEIRLPKRGVQPIHAVLEWAGLPEYPHLRPLFDDGSVQVAATPAHGTVALTPTDTFQIGPYRLNLEYADL